MSLPTIAVRYTCGQCGVTDRSVDVVQRRSGQDIVHWIRVMATSAISVDHRRTSPFCTATMMQNVKIPVPKDDEQLGGAR